MPTRSLLARRSRLALAGLALVVIALAPAGAGAKTVSAKLRVLTPTSVLDPGTTYVVGPQKVKTDPRADCLGTGGSGALFDIPDPTGLGLLAAGAKARGALRPLSVSDGSGFGIAVCGIGDAKAQPGSFWYFKRNHAELTVGVDQEPIRNGDDLLAYLSPDNFPSPNPKELELRAPARTVADQPFPVQVLEHGCVSDPNPPYATTCSSQPAAGVTISGAGPAVTTGADGTAMLTVPETNVRLIATRGTDIPSETLPVCVDDQPAACPTLRIERVIGTPGSDRIKTGRGSESVRAGAGADRIDVRGGGNDSVDCGRGEDLVIIDRGDEVAPDCERVRRR